MSVKMEPGRPILESHSLLVLGRFFGFSVVMIKESLRPVLEPKSLFTRNCWLQTGSF